MVFLNYISSGALTPSKLSDSFKTVETDLTNVKRAANWSSSTKILE